MRDEAGGDGTTGDIPAKLRASKPAILAVDDDPQVLASVARDLRRQYGERFRILRAPDGQKGLAVVEELTLAADPLALVAADQRMPGMTGIELHDQAPGSGTGLGLTISHTVVVRQHGGRMSVESAPGRTCFRVELPVMRPRPDGAADA